MGCAKTFTNSSHFGSRPVAAAISQAASGHRFCVNASAFHSANFVAYSPPIMAVCDGRLKPRLLFSQR
ncbi:hypothetical protein SprV_0200700500 [Sparganum proliferum]